MRTSHSKLARVALLALFVAPAAARAETVDSFLTGLDALAAGRYEQAADLLNAAADADPTSADRHLERAVALMLAGRAEAAALALARAGAGDTKDPEVLVWSMTSAILFQTPVPTGMPPTPKSVAYAPKLYVAAFGTRSSNAEERERARAALQEVAREFAQARRVGGQSVAALYAAGRYREALQVIDMRREKGGLDASLLTYAGHCRGALKDFAGARQQYTASLRLQPAAGESLVGRARCEVVLGALDAAEADLAIARRLRSPEVAQVEALMTLARKAPQKSPGLTDRAEQYTRELSRLTLDASDRPNDHRPLLALFGFYVHPVVVSDVTINGVPTRGGVPCGAKDLKLAAAALDRAIKLAPNDPEVILQHARLELVRGHEADMVTIANPALAVGRSDLDVAIGYAKYAGYEASRMEQAARNLRKPGYFRDTQLDNGMWTKEYVGPTGDDYNRAKELERTAREWRGNAVYALNVLQKQLAGRTDTQSRVTLHMADAFQRAWAQDLPGAIDSAERALALDPTNAYALRFLTEAYAKANSPKARATKAALADAGRYE